MLQTTIKVRSPKPRLGDLVFANLARGSGILILGILAGVAIFLALKGLPAFGANTSELDGQANLLVYVAKLTFGTLLAALLALLMATPLSLPVALAVSHYAPRRLAASGRYPAAPGAESPTHCTFAGAEGQHHRPAVQHAAEIF